MTRTILALVLGIGLSAAPAANAAMLACQPDTSQACCCPEPSSASPCAVSCIPDAPAAAAIASPVSVRLAAAWATDLATAPSALQIAPGFAGLHPPVSHTLHAPPRRRYLLARVLRL